VIVGKKEKVDFIKEGRRQWILISSDPLMYQLAKINTSPRLIFDAVGEVKQVATNSWRWGVFSGEREGRCWVSGYEPTDTLAKQAVERELETKNEEPKGLTYHIKEKAMKEFEEYLDNAINAWDGASTVDVIVKFSMTPSINIGWSENRMVNYD
jgi:hypothetical protein